MSRFSLLGPDLLNSVLSQADMIIQMIQSGNIDTIQSIATLLERNPTMTANVIVRLCALDLFYLYQSCTSEKLRTNIIEHVLSQNMSYKMHFMQWHAKYRKEIFLSQELQSTFDKLNIPMHGCVVGNVPRRNMNKIECKLVEDIKKYLDVNMFNVFAEHEFVCVGKRNERDGLFDFLPFIFLDDKLVFVNGANKMSLDISRILFMHSPSHPHKLLTVDVESIYDSVTNRYYVMTVTRKAVFYLQINGNGIPTTEQRITYSGSPDIYSPSTFVMCDDGHILFQHAARGERSSLCVMNRDLVVVGDYEVPVPAAGVAVAYGSYCLLFVKSARRVFAFDVKNKQMHSNVICDYLPDTVYHCRVCRPLTDHLYAFFNMRLRSRENLVILSITNDNDFIVIRRCQDDETQKIFHRGDLESSYFIVKKNVIKQLSDPFRYEYVLSDTQYPKPLQIESMRVDID